VLNIGVDFLLLHAYHCVNMHMRLARVCTAEAGGFNRIRHMNVHSQAVAALHPTRTVSIDLSTLRGKHLNTLGELTANEIGGLLTLAGLLRATFQDKSLVYQPLV
jgi:hypothetical protein